MELVVNTQSEAWVAIVNTVLGAPETAPRGLKVREVADRVSVVIARPQDGFVAADGRKFNHAISAVEGLSLIGQCSVPELHTDRVAALASYQSGSVFRGAYGPRAEGVLDDVVSLLKRDPDSRQAVVSLFDSRRDLGRWTTASKSGDVPCTLAIQFLVRGGALQMWVVMRSQDAWFGSPFDYAQFSLLQFAVAQALGVDVGAYTHSVGSLHLYEEHWAAAAAVGEPRSAPVGHLFGGTSWTIEEVASRARRVLLGHGLDDPSPLEAWLLGWVRR